MSIKIIIADDHNLFRSGLIDILRSDSEFEIAGETGRGEDLSDMYEAVRPDILLVDISMPPGMSGIEAVKKIKSKYPAARALFLSMYDSEEYVYAVLISGGNGLLNKSVEKNELFKALRKVHSGENYFKDCSPEQLEQIRNKFAGVKFTLSNNYNDLTEREKKILIMISEGYTSKEIGRELNLSKRTIDTHRIHLIQKLDVKSLPGLVRFAIQYSNLSKKQ